MAQPIAEVRKGIAEIQELKTYGRTGWEISFPD